MVTSEKFGTSKIAVPCYSVKHITCKMDNCFEWIECTSVEHLQRTTGAVFIDRFGKNITILGGVIQIVETGTIVPPHVKEN